MERLEDYLTKQGWKRDLERTKEDFRCIYEKTKESCQSIDSKVNHFLYSGGKGEISRLKASLIGLASFFLYGINENFQQLNFYHKIDYPTFLVNWGSAIACTAFLTGAFLGTTAIMRMGKNMERVSALIPATLFTANEFHLRGYHHPSLPDPTTFDPMDIFFYWVTAIATYTLVKKDGVGKIKRIFKKTTTQKQGEEEYGLPTI